MKKVFLILLLCIILSACGTNKSVPNNSSTTVNTVTIKPSPTVLGKPDGKVTDYFPISKDTHLIFKGTGNEYASFDTYIDYLKDNVVQERRNNGGTVSVGVYVIKDGELRKTFNKGETYYRYDYTASSNMDEIIIKEPIAEGSSWTLKDGSVRSITSIDKEIDTGVGIFKALEITTKKADSTVVDYFVKNVGLVKSVFINGTESNTISSVWDKVETKKSFKQDIKFYFPEFNKDRIVFISRNIEIKTNDDMKLIFQRELKLIPADSDLAKVLTPNVSILGIVLDDEKNTVTVDFSSQLVKDMNAGTSFEGMLLRCITNTFGTYYQKDNVIITVEGKLYESGHYMLKPGESYKVKNDDVTEYKKP